jgi:hypothetical protein
MNLYELTTDLKELQEIDFTQAEEEQIEEVKGIIKTQIESKSAGIIAVIRNEESDIDAIKVEIKRLQELKKSKENKIENLKKYTKECLEDAEIKKVSTSLGNMTVRKNPASVDVLDENLIPIEYKKEVVEVKVDKKAILADLKEGVVIEGAALKNSTSLMIK